MNPPEVCSSDQVGADQVGNEAERFGGFPDAVDDEILDDIERALMEAQDGHYSPDLDELDCAILLDLVRKVRA